MSKQSKNTPNNSPLAPLAVGFFIGAIVVGAAALIWNHDHESRSYPVYRTAQSATTPAAAPAIDSMAFETLGATALAQTDPAVNRVASQFDCSCGKCSDTLDTCSCETAQQERTFIQGQLQKGHSETEAVEALKQKFGGLRLQNSLKG